MAAEKSHPLVTSSNLLLDAKDENFQLIHRVIEEIIEEKRNATTGVEEDRLLLSGLLFQLESLKEEESDGQPEHLADPNEIISKVNAEVSGQEASKHQEKTDKTSTEEIVRELREVKRQNRITHWLLSVMIVITAVWQLSEVSLILSVKNKVSNPLKTVGSMVTGFFKGNFFNGKSTQTDEGNSSASPSCPHVEAPQLPSIHIPELPQLD
ncbi:uncharacterized protein [Aristolochia californica]|uniref:uncharacterized protein n=1 Tax=Aristolochia californica TaxID=171875 RepID=UPI0035DBD5A2